MSGAPRRRRLMQGVAGINALPALVGAGTVSPCPLVTLWCRDSTYSRSDHPPITTPRGPHGIKRHPVAAPRIPENRKVGGSTPPLATASQDIPRAPDLHEHRSGAFLVGAQTCWAREPWPRLWPGLSLIAVRRPVRVGVLVRQAAEDPFPVPAATLCPNPTSSPWSRRRHPAGFSPAGLTTSARTSHLVGDRPGRRGGRVHLSATNSRCRRNSVAGVTKNALSGLWATAENTPPTASGRLPATPDRRPDDARPRPRVTAPAARRPWTPDRAAGRPPAQGPTDHRVDPRPIHHHQACPSYSPVRWQTRKPVAEPKFSNPADFDLSAAGPKSAGCDAVRCGGSRRG
ncbi:MAG: hypothetical protein QG597_4396 [Actinomycetota bacterium]|nr:hypothetical protein [Actinomycetota bacterium]